MVNNAGFWVGIEWEGMLGDVMKLSVLPRLPPSLLYPIVIIINVHLNCPHGHKRRAAKEIGAPSLGIGRTSFLTTEYEAT